MVVSLKCFYCGISTFKGAGTRQKSNFRTWDHMIPKSRGGSGMIGNKVVCCMKCNIEKGCLTFEEYRVVIGFRTKKVTIEPGKIFAGETEYTHDIQMAGQAI